MIYTITFNPSLDYVIRISDIKLYTVNRTEDEVLFPGGKGINVSIVLKNLNCDSVALGFTAGFTGAEIERRLTECSVSTGFIRLREGLSRINVKIRAEQKQDDENSEETEINGMGPTIDAEAMEELYHKLDQLATGDFLVLAGSIPPSLPKSAYADMMERLSGRGIRFVVDATGEALLKTLSFHPFLIKPNHHELGAIFGVDLVEMSGGNFETLKEYVKKYALELQKMGALNVLISMGGMGAMLVTEQGHEFYAKAPEGKVVNSVGAGDSMVAGFLAGYLQEEEKWKIAHNLSSDSISNETIAHEGSEKDNSGKSDLAKGAIYLNALRMGICTGSASAFSRELATKEEVMELLKQY